jgi:hypothetical protein
MDEKLIEAAASVVVGALRCGRFHRRRMSPAPMPKSFRMPGATTKFPYHKRQESEPT